MNGFIMNLLVASTLLILQVNAIAVVLLFILYYYVNKKYKSDGLNISNSELKSMLLFMKKFEKYEKSYKIYLIVLLIIIIILHIMKLTNVI